MSSVMDNAQASLKRVASQISSADGDASAPATLGATPSSPKRRKLEVDLTVSSTLVPRQPVIPPARAAILQDLHRALVHSQKRKVPYMTTSSLPLCIWL